MYTNGGRCDILSGKNAAALRGAGAEVRLRPLEMSAPAAAHGAPDHTRPVPFLMYFTGERKCLPGQIDHSSHIGFRHDAAEPLPAKRGRAGNGRLIFPRAFFRGRGRAAADRGSCPHCFEEKGVSIFMAEKS